MAKKKDAVAEAVKVEEVKPAIVQEAAPEAVKAEPEAKIAAKTAKKPAAKKPAAKKTGAKSTAKASAKKPAAKAAAKTSANADTKKQSKAATEVKKVVEQVKEKVAAKDASVYIQFKGKEYTEKAIVEMVTAACVAEYPKKKIKSLEIYINTDESAAYYVLNGMEGKKIEL